MVSRVRACAESSPATMSEGMKPALASASSAAVASGAVPKSAKVILFCFFAVVIEFFCFVGIENAIEVIHFMLEDMCKEPRRAARNLLTVFVVRTDRCFFGAGDDAPSAAD